MDSTQPATHAASPSPSAIGQTGNTPGDGGVSHPGNHYEFEVIAKCPNGSLNDRYDCLVSSQRVIPAETINAFRLKLANRKAFQEDIADDLRNELQARVVLIGWHFGVKITCVRE